MRNGGGQAAVNDGVGMEPAESRGRAWWCALAMILFAAGAVRWRLLDVPLERDEGEYAVFAQLLLDGVPPYSQAVNMKLPGIYLVYAAVLTVFGETARGIHLGLLVANLASGLLVGLLARRLFRSGLAGLVAAATLLAFTLSWRLQGLWANAEAFVVPIVLFSGLLFLKSSSAAHRKSFLFLTGLSLGCAVLVKQHAVFYCMAAGVTLVAWHLGRRHVVPKRMLRELGVLAGACSLPYAVTVIVLSACGVFDRFWEWTWSYAQSYAGHFGLSDMATNLASRSTVLVSVGPLIALACLGILSSLFRSGGRKVGLVLLILAAFSFGSISVGYFYRPHYFQLLAPVVALGCAAWFGRPSSGRRSALQATLVLVAVGNVPFVEKVELFELTPRELTVKAYGDNGFDGMPVVGRYLNEIVPEQKRFAVIGSEPELYFYADRRPATAYMYTYALMELQPKALQMQREMAQEVERQNPDVLVVVTSPSSWFCREGSETYILEWMERFIANGFVLDAILLKRNTRTVFVRGEAARQLRRFQELVLLEVYRRVGTSQSLAARR